MKIRLPRSEFSQKLSGIVAGAIVVVLLLYGLPSVLAQVSDGHRAQQVNPKNDHHPELAVVNLPAGEKFVDYGPVVEGFQTYVTEKRPAGEKPRRLTIFRPSMTTARSWNVYIYIQEH